VEYRGAIKTFNSNIKICIRSFLLVEVIKVVVDVNETNRGRFCCRIGDSTSLRLALAHFVVHENRRRSLVFVGHQEILALAGITVNWNVGVFENNLVFRVVNDFFLVLRLSLWLSCQQNVLVEHFLGRRSGLRGKFIDDDWAENVLVLLGADFSLAVDLVAVSRCLAFQQPFLNVIELSRELLFGCEIRIELIKHRRLEFHRWWHRLIHLLHFMAIIYLRNSCRVRGRRGVHVRADRGVEKGVESAEMLLIELVAVAFADARLVGARDRV
jgi:hypothetical protein